MQLCPLGQCPHGALFHAVPGCCKCFQQCRIAPKCPSYPTLLEALATPWDSVEQCSMGTLSQGAKLHRLDRPLYTSLQLAISVNFRTSQYGAYATSSLLLYLHGLCVPQFLYLFLPLVLKLSKNNKLFNNS